MRPTAGGWRVLGDGLRLAAEALHGMAVEEIVSALNRVAERWSNRRWPYRRAVRDLVAEATGFSSETIDRSFDVELRNYRAGELWRALRRELGDPAVLDGFQPDRVLRGRTMGLGPRVTLQILTGNVPGLPALAIVRALLVKSAVIAKVASGEPTFAAGFARSLADVDPRLGDAVVVTYWERSDQQALAAAVDQADAVVAYGGLEACAAIRLAARPDQLFVEHRQRVSVGLLSREYLAAKGPTEVARLVAEDVCAFNQHACIAPQAYFVEGDAATARLFGGELADALERYGRRCPLGRLSEGEAAAMQMRRAGQQWKAVACPDADMWQADSLEWTVAVEPDPLRDGMVGNRFVRLVPVASLQSALAMLRPFGSSLQNVGLGARHDEMPALATALARLGASRICEPGRMREPSLAWRHDGRMRLSELVRWCDVEMHAWAEGERSPEHAAGPAQAPAQATLNGAGVQPAMRGRDAPGEEA
jgi:hypothetical protein